MLEHIREFLNRPIPIALVCAVLAHIWITRGTFDREMARFTICKNRLWQHSGCHPRPIVELDRDFRVLGVASCPLCDDHESPMAFVIVDDGPLHYLDDDSFIPADTIRDAELRLALVWQSPEYHERWQEFKVFREQMKEHIPKTSQRRS